MFTFNRSNQIGIGLAVYLRDHFTAESRRVVSSMEAMGLNAEKTIRKNLDMMNQIGRSSLLVGAAMAYPIARAIKTYTEFEYTMDAIKAVTDGTDAQMDALGKTIIKVGLDSVYSITEIAEAAKTLGQSGFTIKQIQQSIKGINSLAAATDSKLPKTADFMIQLLSMYDKPAGEAGKFADLITYAMNKSNLNDLDQLIEGFRYAGDTLATLNISIEDSIALFMRLSNAGIKGSAAGTAIANMFRYVTKGAGAFATQRQKDALGWLGLGPKDFQDKQGNLVNPEIMLAKIAKATQGMTDMEVQSVMEALTGVRGKRALVPLFRKLNNSADYSSLRGGIAGMQAQFKPGEYSGQVAQTRTDNLMGDILRLKDSVLAFYVNAIKPMAPVLRFFVKGLTSFINLMTKFVANTWVGKGMVFLYVTLTGILLTFGLINIAMGTLGKLMILGKSTAGQYGATIKWVWNSASAALWRYITLLSKANSIHYAGGAFRYKAGTRGPQGQPMGGQFVPGGFSAMAMLGLGGKGGMLRNMGAWLLRIVKTLGPFGSVLSGIVRVGSRFLGLLGPWGWAIMGVITALDLFSDSIFGVTDEFEKERQERLNDRTIVNRFIGMDEFMQTIKNNKGQIPETQKKVTNLNIYLDGKLQTQKTIQDMDEDQSFEFSGN